MRVAYRHFRNTDPPALVRLWNEAVTSRAAVRLQGPMAFEDGVLAKTWFDPKGLIVAESADMLVGFVHAGFGPDAGGQTTANDAGVVCALAVVPEFRRQGIGRELLT